MTSFGGGGVKCTICDKTAYPAETVSYEKQPYHVECFKCSECAKKITPASAAKFEDKIFCTQCFSKGGYSQKQRNVKWEAKESSSNALASKFGGGGTPCTICAKTVYPAETLSFDKRVYHIACFTCTTCSKKMTSSDAAAYEEQVYCRKCFQEGGFTQKQRNVKWEAKGSSGSAVASKFGGGGVSCEICSKTVYPAEMLSYEKKAYHQECFKCTTCTKKITASDAAAYDNDIYCRKCFAAGGFTQKQRNVKWVAKEGTGGATSSKFGGGGTKCHVCDKTVYAAETVSYEKKPFHATCFKCCECDKKVTPSGCGMFEDKLYCTQCFAKGGYAKKQVATHKTSSEPKQYDNRFAKFGGGGNKCVVCTKTVYPAEQLSFEKNIFHIACFKCSHEGCSKGGKPITVNDAQYTKDGDVLTVYCNKCFGELGLNRA